MHRLVGFTSFNRMLAHIGLITWGYAAGDLAPRPGEAVGPDRRLPGHAARRRRHRLPGHGRRHQHPGRPARGCATSRGTCCTSTPTSASGSRCPTSSGPARSSSPPPRGPCSGGACGSRPPASVLVWRVGCRCGAAPATGSGHLGRPRGRRLRVGPPHRPPAGRAPRARRPVLHLALPHRPRLDPGAPVLALRGAGRTQPADHRQGPRRRQRRAPRGCARAPGCSSKGPTAGSPPGPGPGHGSRSSAPASGSPRCGPWPRSSTTRPATPCCSTASPASRCSPPSSTRSPASAGSGRSGCPGPAGAGLLARRRRRRRRDDLAAAGSWVPDIAERDVYVCGPEPWADAVRRLLAAAGVPADRVHAETFGW